MYAVHRQKDGKLIRDYREILNEQFNFYKDLYTSNEEVKFTMTNTRNVQLSEARKLEFEMFISQDELFDAMMTLKRGKVCGSDGLSIEFYARHWKLLVTPLYHMLYQAYIEGSLSTSARQGIVSLIPKGSADPTYLANWRPITMLNSDYKIYAKALSNRLDTVLPEMVGKQQTGFIKGRSIQNNLAKTREIIAYLHKAKKARSYRNCGFL